jgi:DNA-binding winged helix-turn-helix (wHTH) protein/tetratricopeptide (TPR) repeat protein
MNRPGRTTSSIIQSIAMPSRKQGKYQFEEFEIDLGRRSLRRQGLTIAVSPKTFDLLVFFVLNANQTLSKEQLIAGLWPDTQEEETNLGQHIFLLRRALTGAQPGEKLILAVPGHGYRFMPEVTSVAAEAPREPLPIQRLTLRPGADPLPEVSTRIEPAESEKPREIHAEIVPKTIRKSRHSKLLRDPDPIEESESSFSEDKAGLKVITTLRGMKAWQLALSAATLIAVALLGWLAWHLAHRIVRDSTTVVVGDFQNSTANTEFDRALSTALLIDLEQSPYFSIASNQRVSEVTTEMKLGPDQQITSQIAHDVCRQLQNQVYITGAVRGVAQKYFITVQAFDCASNKRLAQSRGIADSANGVVSLLDRVTIDLRKQLGEPAKLIYQFSKPVFAENTASLTALKAYADALHLESQGKSTDAIPLFQRAIELDPRFVNAYADLGIAHANLGQSEPAKDNLTKAYNMRDEVNEQDKLFLIATYNTLVTGDIQASIRNDQAWTAMYPRNPVPLGDLAALQIQEGKAAIAIEPARRALELNPTDTGLYVNLARAQMHLGQFDEAAETCNLAIRRHRDNVEIHAFLLQIAFLRLDQSNC